MLNQVNFTDQLKAISETVDQDEKAARGWHMNVRLQADRLLECAELLLASDFYLSFLTVVHVKPDYEVIYQFGHFEKPCRIMVRVSAGADTSVPSIANIFHGAAWHEREAHEFFGVGFEGHPHLTSLILSREERHFNPLVKDDARLKSRADIFPPQPAGNAQEPLRPSP
jgi:NADH-quinone oxidoreductase subunit C